MRRKVTGLLIITCLLAVSPNSIAQQKGAGSDELKGPGDTFKLIAPKFALGKTVRGVPFSATAITETIQILSDGNQIISKSESKIYRDSQGRTRNEGMMTRIGKWVADGEAQQIAFINDPVAGFTYGLDPNTRTAYKYRITMQTVGELINAGGTKPNALKPNPGKVVVEKPGAIDRSRPQSPSVEAARPPIKSSERTSADGRRKIESLDKQVIEGVEAEGTRTTLTIAEGEVGNVLPIRIVDENWYSPELQVMVLTKHSDPRSGETIYRLTDINRSEPNRALFEVPADYTVKDESATHAKRKPAEEEL